MKQETHEEAGERLYPNRESFLHRFQNIERKAFTEGVKWEKQFNNTSEVTRVEVIQHSESYNGRAYTNYDAKEVEIQFQDDGKTLKIFLK